MRKSELTVFVLVVVVGGIFWFWRRHDPRLKKLDHLAAFVAASGVMVGAWLWWSRSGVEFFANRWESGSDALARAGQAGDLFGGFNALFASLAAVGAAFAVYFQYHAMRSAQKQLVLQSFEPMLGRLMDQQARVEDEITILTSLAMDQDIHCPLDTHSRSPLAKLAREFRLHCLRAPWFANLLIANMPDVARVSRLVTEYDSLYSLNEHELGRYFRSLYHIFKFIDRSQLSDEEKVAFANIARSTLGKDHLFLLALNGLTERGKEFKTLIERYGLLKHLAGSSDDSADRKMIDWGYHKGARLSMLERAEQA